MRLVKAALWKEGGRLEEASREMTVFDIYLKWIYEIWRDGGAHKSIPVSQRRIRLVGEVHALPPEGIHCPCPGTSSFLTSLQVWAFVSSQSSVLGLTRGNLKVFPYHCPPRNETCDGKYSQSNREWQIQTTQPPRRVGSLVQRSVHSSPGGVGDSISTWKGPEKRCKRWVGS